MQWWRAGAVAGLLMTLAACSGPDTGKTELVFQGRCVDSSGRGVPTFHLRVFSESKHPGEAAVVTQDDGRYETRVQIVAPATATDRVLGSSNDRVTIDVFGADGYNPKSFNVTADQLFVGKPNTLNVTLEPAS